MRYLTNLDKAELQQVDLNELCEHVIEFLASELDGKSVQLETLPVPELSCRPQQISAVLSNLLRNAAAALDENGSIEVSSACADDEVVMPVHSFRTLLSDLATVTKNQVENEARGLSFVSITRPTPLQHKAFNLLEINPRTM